LLRDRELLKRDRLVSLPKENRAGRIPPIERVQQVSDSRSSPDVSPLHLGKTQLTPFDHADEFFDCRLGLGHSLPLETPEHVDEFGDHPELPLVVARQHARFELWIEGLERDSLVVP
jgi:hypothetical protein